MSAPSVTSLVTFDWLTLAPVAVPALGAVLVVAVVALGVLPGPLLQTTIADVTAITTPGSVIR